VSKKTNFWGYLNAGVGTYANTPQGYKYRGIIVLAGGSANMPQDAVYAQINSLDGTGNTQLVGDNTYVLTFRPPSTGIIDLPAIGALPPTANDPATGEPYGFWSIHLYQTDTKESAAPFLTQPSVLNTAYSNANLAVTSVNTSTNELTVQQAQPLPWTPLLASTPVLFGSTAAQYGLQPGVPYYLRNDATQNQDGTWSFQVTTLWKQDLSPDNVPEQGADPSQPGSGPGDPVQLQQPAGPIDLQWGPIQPVTQLGSQQLTSGSLARNDDGSVTIWLAPTLPPHAPATNWIPTPSKSYYQSVYGMAGMPTNIRPLIRIYYPRVTPPSILPPSGGNLQATYVFPSLKQVLLRR
jgi:hypothetical protein